MNILLWILQGLLAALFLFAGVPKLIMPIEELMKNASPNAIRFPDLFLKFIGVCEVLGALGLILPGLLRRKQWLTPLAAFLFFILMVGAVVVSIMGDGVKAAIIPFVVGLLCWFVAYERWKVRPLR